MAGADRPGIWGSIIKLELPVSGSRSVPSSWQDGCRIETQPPSRIGNPAHGYSGQISKPVARSFGVNLPAITASRQRAVCSSPPKANQWACTRREPVATVCFSWFIAWHVVAK